MLVFPISDHTNFKVWQFNWVPLCVHTRKTQLSFNLNLMWTQLVVSQFDSSQLSSVFFERKERKNNNFLAIWLENCFKILKFVSCLARIYLFPFPFIFSLLLHFSFLAMAYFLFTANFIYRSLLDFLFLCTPVSTKTSPVSESVGVSFGLLVSKWFRLSWCINLVSFKIKNIGHVDGNSFIIFQHLFILFWFGWVFQWVTCVICVSLLFFFLTLCCILLCFSLCLKLWLTKLESLSLWCIYSLFYFSLT